MGAVPGALVGGLGLIALETVLRNPDQTSGLIASLSTDDLAHPGLVQRVLSPQVPLISDHRTGRSSSGGSGVLGQVGGALEWLNPLTAPGKAAGALAGSLNPF